MSAPRVSVVMATYNSSHLLRYAIESVRLSDEPRWEAIVVGDHCTDDTEEMIASLDDDRIRFLNLDRNSGQQATPNNVGLEHVRGDYVAFLNQDDLFLPHHLSKNLERMESSDAELICSPYAVILLEQRDHIEQREVVARMGGFEGSGRFDPRQWHIASSWFMRRDVVERVGPWRLESQTFVTPSQDWLFRASRAGVRIHCPREISLIVSFSGERQDSYRTRDDRQHEFIFREVVASDALRPALYQAVEASIRERRRPADRRWKRLQTWRRKLRRRAEDALVLVGIHPSTPRMIRRYGWRGGFIRHLKKRTG